MDTFYRQFQFLHTLLPYFPASNRMLFSYLLYYLELKHMYESFREEQDYLNTAPENPDFPDTEELINMLTKNMPQSDVERIKKMMDLMKMMEMMENVKSSDHDSSVPPEMPKQAAAQPEPQPEAEPGFTSRMQGHTPPPGINNDLLKRMMSPKQQELFEQYRNLFKNE
jgi:hypothetical protein